MQVADGVVATSHSPSFPQATPNNIIVSLAHPRLQYFTVKMSDGVVATSYSKGDKFFIDPQARTRLPAVWLPGCLECDQQVRPLLPACLAAWWEAEELGVPVGLPACLPAWLAGWAGRAGRFGGEYSGGR